MNLKLHPMCRWSISNPTKVFHMLPYFINHSCKADRTTHSQTSGSRTNDTAILCVYVHIKSRARVTFRWTNLHRGWFYAWSAGANSRYHPKLSISNVCESMCGSVCAARCWCDEFVPISVPKPLTCCKGGVKCVGQGMMSTISPLQSHFHSRSLRSLT